MTPPREEVESTERRTWTGEATTVEQCGGDTSSPGDTTSGRAEEHREEGRQEAETPPHFPGHPGKGEGAATKPVVEEAEI